MPSDYECPGCKLGFRLGFCHYQVFSDGYLGCRQAVCSQCGLQHSLNVPFADSDAIPTLESQPTLLLDAFYEPRPGWSRTLRCPYRAWTRLTQQSHDRINGLLCHLGATPTLVDDWPRQGAPCPNCQTYISGQPLHTSII